MAILTTINLSSLDGSNGFRVDGEATDDFSGGSVSNAGDVNGDGFDDVIIGASGVDQGGYDGTYEEGSGAAYVVFGKASGFNATLDLSSLDGSNGFRLDGETINDRDGLYSMTTDTVSNAGDINGDGFDDVLVGAIFRDFSTSYSADVGYSYVVFGKSSGFSPALDLSSLDGDNGFRVTHGFGDSSSTSSAGDFNGDGFDDLILGAPSKSSGDASYIVFGKAGGFSAGMNASSLDGSNGFRLIAGISPYDAMGSSVSNAGDVNGDGFDDVIIGARDADPNGDGSYSSIFDDSGSSYVMFGHASGFDATLDLSGLDGSNGFRLDGVTAGDRLGSKVSNAGDVNGDGFDDLIIGAPEADPNGDDSGSSYVVFGKASGFSATLDLSTLDGNNGFRLDGEMEGASFGRSISGAGDVNGDGFDDLIVGAVVASSNGYYSNSSYVIFGKAAGFDATLDFFNLDSDSGFRLDGSSNSVSGAGDVNGDGLDDLLVGGPVASPSGNDRAGSSYIIFGSRDFEGTVTYVGTRGDDTLTGTLADERFEGRDGNDTLIGGGGADVFQGGNGDDTIRVPDLAFQTLDGGSGTDTLELTGEDIDLNLANFHDTINGIDTIDLTGSGDNTLTFTLANLLDVSEGTLKVNGDAGDRVVIRGGGWLDGGIDGGYHTYTNRDNTVLQIGVAVDTDPPALGGVIDLSSLDGSNGFRLDGEATYDYSGSSVSNAGDVNGDGFSDLVIGAPGADPNGSYSGSSYVVFGRASGFDAAMNLSNLDGSNGFRLDGEEGDRSGSSVSNAGDVNGDGFDDVIIGAFGAGSSSSYVIFGQASGFDAVMDLSALDGSNGFRLDGERYGSSFDSSVSNAGDVNGDGFDDLLVGKPRAGLNGSYSGSSYVVFGKATGFDATMDLSSLDGSNGFRLDGVARYDSSGGSVSGAGDVNGDGFDDVIIGAIGADPSGDFSGSSYVVFGKAAGFDAVMNLSSLDGNNGFRLDGVAEGDATGFSVSSAGDVNGDGFDDVIVGAPGTAPYGTSYVVFGKASGFDAVMDLSSLDGSNGFRLDGVARYDSSGGSVSSAGDVNGDGFDDVIVGADDTSYVVFGKASGSDATLDLSSLDGSNGVRLDGDGSITSVSGAEDVNGDGFDDLIIGAPGANSSYIIFGSHDFGGGGGSGLPEILGTPGDDILKGTSAAEIFEAGDGNDRMIGRGGADVFHGDAGDDYIQVADLGFASVDGGSGNDTLHTDGKDLNLDLGVLGDKIHGIETICLFGRGDNTLTLTAEGLLNLSDTDNTLRVNGNAGDHITVLDDGWVDEGARGQGYFHVYTNDDAVLLVGMNVTVDFV